MLTKITFKINRQGTEVLSVELGLDGVNITQQPCPKLTMRGLMGYPTDCMTVQHGDKIEITTEEMVE